LTDAFLDQGVCPGIGILGISRGGIDELTAGMGPAKAVAGCLDIMVSGIVVG